ncbi:hypothetical protein [Demequina aurantiaca]|uniref:hypothetical protein n=1 Tax=Demequina aurantiaca TaxID=676200 RepID=UPI003D33ED4D
MSHPRTYALTLAVLLALPLAACSGSSGDDPLADPDVVDAAATGDGSTEELSTSGSEPTTDADANTDNDSSASDLDSDDPCVLTAAQISSVTGGSYDEGQVNAEVSSDPVYYCEYLNTDADVVGLVIVLTTPRGFSIDSQRPTYETVSDNVVDVTVAGADSAYSVEEWTVLAQVGDYGLTVQNLEKVEGDPDGETVALAELAVANLG